jgi:uncharacterized protein (TIGR02594 family)
MSIAYQKDTYSSYPWMEFAVQEGDKNVKEVPGRGPERSNDRIEEYLRTCSNIRAKAQNKDDTPWCSAFVNWCMRQAGLWGTGHARAISWLSWGHPCSAQYGAVTILKPDGEDQDQNSGHVSLYVASVEGKIWLLGGNQDNRVRLSGYYPDRVRGYRWPGIYWDQRPQLSVTRLA